MRRSAGRRRTTSDCGSTSPSPAPGSRAQRVAGRARGSRVEELARPQLEVQRAPELETGLERAVAVVGEAPLRGGRVDEPALRERSRREDVGRDLAERAAEEARGRRDETEF